MFQSLSRTLCIGMGLLTIATSVPALADPHDYDGPSRGRGGRGHDDHHHHYRGNDRRGGTNIYMNSGVPYYPYQPYVYQSPRYIPSPIGIYERGPRYYTSNYYTQRYIPVEPATPYVEVRCSNQSILGTVVGGATGGLVANQFARHSRSRTAVTIGGALLGSIIGHSIDRSNESCAYQALEYAQPNTQVAWADPEGSYAYTVTPGPVTTSGNGRYCREYQAKVLVGNQLQDGYGQACRQPDGSWEITN